MARVFLALASVVLSHAATAQNAAAKATPDTGAWQAPAGSRRYVAVVSSPWVFDLVIAGARVTGEARELPNDPAQAQPSPPFRVSSGTARGDSIAFVLESNGGDRVASFRGLRVADRIDFERSVQVVRGEPGGTGIVGAAGAARFSAWLIARGQSIPTGAVHRPASVTQPLAGPRKTIRHAGFTIDVTDVASAADADSVITAVKEQVDLVAKVKAPASTQAFFRSVPLVMQPITGSARYGAGRIVIPLRTAVPYERSRPILLHELCHAFHDQRLADGFDNAAVLAFYEQAKHSGKFPADSYVLSNHGEYFAMMASVFLHGSAMREPFGRDSIRVKQPGMYAWLVKQFGAR